MVKRWKAFLLASPKRTLFLLGAVVAVTLIVIPQILGTILWGFLSVVGPPLLLIALLLLLLGRATGWFRPHRK